MKSEKKIRRMVEIARMYYEEDIKQEDIAKILDVSRPLVSKILAEAKSSGIVSISINSPLDEKNILESELIEKFGLENVIIIENAESKELTNSRLYKASANIINKLMISTNLDSSKNKEKFNIGLGWGEKVYYSLSEMDEMNSYFGNTCALIGNFPSLDKAYHSNEIIRIFSEKTETKPEYVYAPAFFKTDEEKKDYTNLNKFKDTKELWKNLDIAVVGVENYPSISDFTSIPWFRDKLQKKNAIGEVVNHYFDINGNIIEDLNDNTMHIPVVYLKNTKRIVVITSEDTKSETILGLMRARLVTDIVLTRKAALEIVKI